MQTYEMKMGYFILLSIFVSLCSPLSARDGFAQPSKHKIYVAVLSNQSFTVGARNPGVGLYVGDDQGESWLNIGFKNMRTFAAEIFPNYGEGLFYTANGNGVIVSRDGGNSWRVTTGWEITEILEASAVPDNPKIIYIGTAYGLWKSIEFGENWQRLTKRFVAGLNIDVADANRIYLGEEDGLLISQNAGKSFSKVKKIASAVNQIAQDNADPDRLYLGTEDDGVYISDDRGKSWRQVPGQLANATVFSVTVDQRNPNRIFVGTFGNGIFRSNDRGKTWQSFMDGLEDIAVYEIAIHPEQSSILYAGTVNRGIFRSMNGGESWTPFALDGTHVLELEIK